MRDAGAPAAWLPAGDSLGDDTVTSPQGSLSATTSYWPADPPLRRSVRIATSDIGPVLQEGTDRAHDLGSAVIQDGRQGYMVTEQRVAPDEPGASDVVTLGCGDLRPDTMRELEASGPVGRWFGAVYLRPLDGAALVACTGEGGDEGGAE